MQNKPLNVRIKDGSVNEDQQMERLDPSLRIQINNYS